jgi:hypothetical protein
MRALSLFVTALRTRTLAIVCVLACAFAACGSNQQEVIEPSGPPPLPPASGSVIGYLVDARRDLALSDEQYTKLQDLDESLSARNGQIDAQLRMMEKPVPAEQLSPQQIKAGEKASRYNNAPGASTIVTADSQKLRRMRDDNDREAMQKAFEVLDDDQVVKAKRILQDRGVQVPGAGNPEPARSSDDGEPLPGMEP